MNTAQELTETILCLSGIGQSLGHVTGNRDQSLLMARLQYATASTIDPELGKAWRNRMIIRSRLRKYASKL
jgi:hypothetical protein